MFKNTEISQHDLEYMSKILQYLQKSRKIIYNIDQKWLELAQ